MDLSRAKTILIVSFLLLNIFLGLRLWYSPQYLRVRGGISGEEAELSRDALQDAGYGVTAVVPRQTPRLTLLHVARPPVGVAYWTQKFWGDEEKRYLSQGASVALQKGNEMLEIYPEGLVTFRRDNTQENATGEDGRSAADRFLRERGLFEDSLKFDLSLARDDGTQFHRYLQTYQGFPLFSGQIELWLGEEGVSDVRIYSLEPLGFSDNGIRVISAAVAADTLIQHPGEFIGKKIVDISLGYYSQHYDADRWEIAPVWRFAASDGSVYYVNAFTGEAEPDII